MGKKSKKNRNGPAANRPSGSPSSALAVPELRADSLGRMPEKDGRRFYALLDCLKGLALPKLEAERLEAKRRQNLSAPPPPLPWVPGGVGLQTPELRNILMDFILRHIDELSEEIDSGRCDALCRRVIGRRLSLGDKEQIRSWKLHIEDDFFVVDHIPNVGAVLCQVGRRVNKETPMNAPIGAERDMHEPRLFVVKGLASPLAELTGRMADRFAQVHPGAIKKYSDRKIALVHTTLVPFEGSLTYMATIIQPSCNHYATPQDMKEAVQLAVETYEKSSLHAAASTENGADIPVFRSLNPETDSHVKRLASDPHNQTLHSIQMHNAANQLAREKTEEQDDDGSKTTLMVSQMVWRPYEDPTHPDFSSALSRAGTGPKPFCIEGIKSNIAHMIGWNDDDPCPFHQEYGVEGKSFKKCCKKAHLKRAAKAERTKIPHAEYLYNPLQEEEAGRLHEAFVSGTVDKPQRHVRISPMDLQVIRIRVPMWAVSIVKERLDECNLFHATLEYKWVYTGYMALTWSTQGMSVFGDVVLNERTGMIEAEAMTAERVTNLIRELRHICLGLDIQEASLEAQPMNKLKPDLEMLEKNRALLEDGLHLDVEASVDKKANKEMGRHCAYCGGGQQDKLARCSGCKSVYYCSVTHQKAHRADHREECKKIAAIREGKSK